MKKKKAKWSWPPDARSHRILFCVVLLLILIITIRLLAN